MQNSKRRVDNSIKQTEGFYNMLPAEFVNELLSKKNRATILLILKKKLEQVDAQS